jgi:transposase
VAAFASSTSGSAGKERRRGLVEGELGLGERARQKGGEAVGPNPTDRGKPGSKHHLLTDRNGVPLAVVLTAANIHDSKVFEELVDAVEPIKRPGRGRPRKRPEKLHADKAYDFPRCRGVLRCRGIKSRIARRGKDTSERLGRHRWVVERTLAWLARYRRLLVRHERRADIHEAFLHLACVLVCLCYAQARSREADRAAVKPFVLA